MKLKWDWLVPNHYDMRESTGSRIAFGFLFSLLPLSFGLGLTIASDGVLAIGIPLLVIGSLCILYGFFEPQIRKLHYTYDLDTEHQTRAIEWYETLTKNEKNQLPNGWEKMIREVGSQCTGQDRYYNNKTVASDSLTQAQEVVRLYRKKNEEVKVPDYRIEMYRELMEQRKQELAQDIKDRKEIEAEIARMP